MEVSTSGQEQYKLLIVDDEPLMTDLLRQTMTKRGFDVQTASSGREAIAIVKAQQEAMSLVIMDVSMPDMDGLQTAAVLETLAPDLPVMLATGHDTEAALESPPANVVAMVQKPYQTKNLIERINAILQHREHG